MLELLKKDIPFEWEENQQHAFDCLKERLMKALILKYPNFDKNFTLH